MVIFDDEIIATHLDAHAWPVVDVVVTCDIANPIHADAAGVFVEDAPVMDVIVFSDVDWPGQSFPITATEADAIAARVADFIVGESHIFTVADADPTAVEGSDLRQVAMIHYTVFSAFKGDGAAMAACEG